MSGDVKPKLTARHMEALAEIARNDGQNWIYWWRKASMADLAAHGFVEPYRPPSLERSKRKALPYRITDLGRALARGFPSHPTTSRQESKGEDRGPAEKHKGAVPGA